MAKLKSECKEVLILLSEYLDDQLDEGTSFHVSAHLTDCKHCYTEFENLAVVHNMIKDNYNLQCCSNLPKVDIASKVMSRVNAVSNSKSVDDNSEPKFSRYFLYVAATLLIIFTTIIYSQNKNKELMASKGKFNTYAMEHANTVYDDSVVQSVEFSSVNLNIRK